MSNLLNPSQTFRPFVFPWAVDLDDEHERMHWVKQEVPMGDDLVDWNTDRLTVGEKAFVTQILRMFTQADVAVGGFYHDVLIPKFKNNEIRNMLARFAAREVTHQHAYALVNDTLGLPEGEYAAFLEYKEMSDKYDFMITADTTTDKGLGLALAKAVFNEGVSLFASFAMLLNFQRHGKMKAMGKVVEWSIKDECYSRDTEVLTNHGWKFFERLEPDDLVAQFDMDRHTTDFVKPSNYSRHWHSGEMVRFHAEAGWADFCVTPNHDMVIWNEFNGKTKKVKAEELKPHARIHVPTATHLASHGAGLTPHERFLIAFQADGTMPSERYTGALCDALPASFSGLRKERKITRLREIVESCGYEYSETLQPDGDTHFRVKVPCDRLLTKNFTDWHVDLSTLTYEWACEFVGEISEWDGHYCCDPFGDETGRVHYGTINEVNAEFVQMIGALCGWRTKITPTSDDRKDSYQVYYRLSMIPSRRWSRTSRLKSERIAYNDEVFCVTVPTGVLVTRRNGVVGISGNTKHVEGVSQLFRAYCEDFPRIVTDNFKRAIYDMAREVVRLEDAFIDSAFALGEITDLKASDVKAYIRLIADRRLTQLGLKPEFNIERNPLPWLDWVIGGIRHSNFFESKSAEYEKAGATGTWKYPKMSRKFVVYTKAGCDWCVKAKYLITSMGHNFVEFDLTDDEDRERFFVANNLTGTRRTMPQVFEEVKVSPDHIARTGVGTYDALLKLLTDEDAI